MNKFIFVCLSVVLYLSVASTPAQAKDFYIAQSGSLTNSGTACSQALPLTWFNNSANWGTAANQISPGTTVHLCGANTTSAGACSVLGFQGSGSNGSPIELLFEPGATLQAPYLCNSITDGTINTHGQSYVIVDLGTNGILQATANGTNLANQQNNAVAIYAGGGSDVEVRCEGTPTSCQLGPVYNHAPGVSIVGISGNGTTATMTCASPCGLAPGYVFSVAGDSNSTFTSHSGTNPSNYVVGTVSGSTLTFASSVSGSSTGGMLFDSGGALTHGIRFVGVNNATADNLVVEGMHWAIHVQISNGMHSGLSIHHNKVFWADHGVTIGDGSAGAVLSGTNQIHDNDFTAPDLNHDFAVWDDAVRTSAGSGAVGENGNHHDIHHVFVTNGTSSSPSSITGLSIYNERYIGDPGESMTAGIYLQGNANGTITGTYLFNNLFADTSANPSHYPANGCINTGTSGSHTLNNTCSLTGNTWSATCYYLAETNADFRNNICSGARTAIYEWSAGTLTDSDNNNYFNLAPNNDFWYQGVVKSTVPLWQAACSCDAHATTGSPLFTPAFQLQDSTSAAWQKGVNLSTLGIAALNNDLAGIPRSATGAWDMGAYESSAANQPPAPPTNLKATVN